MRYAEIVGFDPEYKGAACEQARRRLVTFTTARTGYSGSRAVGIDRFERARELLNK